MKIVVVKWLDATFFSREISVEQAMNDDCLSLTTVGFFVKKDKDKIVIAGELSNDKIHPFRQVSFIPLRSVLSVKTVVKH